MTDLKQIPDYVGGHGLLKGKRVVITAAAGTGIGFAAAKKCIEEGAQVFISDIHEGRLQKAQDALEAETGQRPEFAICNVTVQDDVDNLVKAAAKALGGIDVVINNAGLGGTADLVDMTDEQWMVVLDVTLNGCFRINRAVMQYMKANHGGVIVNNASHVVAGNLEEANPEDIKTMFEINATVPMTLLRAALPYLSSGSSVVNLSSVNAQIPPVAASAFGASKAALEAFTIAAAKEFGPRGIRVNAIAPGIIKVDDVERPAGVLEKYIAATPMGRIGTAEEIAKVVRFLASDNSSYVTGECIRVAGGCGI